MPAHQQDHAAEEQKPAQSFESLLQALQSETVEFIEARVDDVEIAVKRMDSKGVLRPFPRAESPQSTDEDDDEADDEDDDDGGGPE